MRISAKSDYAIRALAELAALPPGIPVKAEQIARSQGISEGFLLGILGELRRAGLLRSQRGQSGGYALARPAAEISLADVIRAVDGPLAVVREARPEEVSYSGHAEVLQDVWVAVRVSLRAVLERVTLAHLAAGELPASVRKLTQAADAWTPR